jgi:GNAT superfamily N-acetyltransferase
VAGKRFKYDEDWLEVAALSDGTSVQLRLVRPSDATLLRDGFLQLSPQSRYLRFLGPRDKLSEAELHYLTDLDGVNHFALGALRVDAIGREEGLGVARFVRFDDEPDVAEPAVTVIDAVQGQGLGTLLLARLVEAAVERGVRCFRCEFLAGNARVRELYRDALRASPHASLHLETEGDVVRAEVSLGELPPGPPEESLLERFVERPLRELLAEVASGRMVARLGRALLKWPHGEADGREEE